jgi:GNAT superfamily N-acetyltransferase
MALFAPRLARIATVILARRAECALMSRSEPCAPQVALVNPADASQLDELRALLRAYEAGLPCELRHEDMEAELQALNARYARGAMFLARASGLPIGCVLLEHRDAECAAVRHLYVAPNARASGAGRALMEELIATARARRYARIVLDTHRELMASAYALYRKLGFDECGPPEKTDDACPTFMELRLGSR